MSSETLSRPDFDARRADGELSVAFVGMSGVGKSYWSTKLAEEAGFERIAVDDLIEAKLGVALKAQGYEGGIADVARWMGQPYEPQSAENQQQYLGHETAIMDQAINRIENPPLGGNLVVDTTGSVVYTGQKIKRALLKYSTVVYLEATDEMREDMFVQYMEEPKPVIWGDVFRQRTGETNEEALARLYPRLLARRSKLYTRMAQVTIKRQDSLEIANTEELLAYVRDKLPTAYANSASYVSSHR